MTTAVVSDYLEAKIINFVLRNEDFSSPASVYLALYTAAPSDAGGGTEVTGGSYARYQMTGGFDTASAGHTQNTGLISFPTATGDWGTVTHIGIFDADVAGNLLFWGQFSASMNILTGKTATIPAGNLDITLNGDWGQYLANKILDHVLNAATFAKPSTAWMALYTTTPTAADSGGVEVSGGSYARKEVWGSAKWDAPTATGGGTENTDTETFTAATANWGTIVGWALRSASSGGNLFFVKALTAQKVVNSGDTFRFNAGAVDIVIS